jgi:hypothetical protein
MLLGPPTRHPPTPCALYPLRSFFAGFRAKKQEAAEQLQKEASAATTVIAHGEVRRVQPRSRTLRRHKTLQKGGAALYAAIPPPRFPWMADEVPLVPSLLHKVCVRVCVHVHVWVGG